MKLYRRPSPIVFLLLIPSFQHAYGLTAAQAGDISEGRDVGPVGPGAGSSSSIPAGMSTNSVPDSSGKTMDAPVDGKDGRPHAGPFVETNAERDRKKAKEIGDGMAATSKPTLKDISSKSASYADGRELPETNDGVMDDPNRTGPKEGTRGTEGGISEKNKGRMGQQGDSSGTKSENKPDPPKEAPPLPHSEQKIVVQNDPEKKGELDSIVKEEKSKSLGGLEKPSDLPEKPHDIPPPLPPSSAKTHNLEVATPPTSSIPPPNTASSSLIQPLHSFLLSLTMIVFSEIGDKTFLIAALMAMKHPRLLVFSAAFAALIAMTVLSAILGHAVPTLIPKRFTNFLAAVLFLVFGAKMLREGYAISPTQGVTEEMKEVEMELEQKEELARKTGRRRSTVTPYMLESGRVNPRKSRSESRLPAPPDSPPSSSNSRSPSPSRRSSFLNALVGINNLFSLLLSPAWVQTFVMTFLGEWGDRSQIATIAMAAGQDYWWVTGGAVSGHGLCTAAAVIGGRAIAGRVSLRVVTLGGGFAFLVFGIIYLVEAMYIS